MIDPLHEKVAEFTSLSDAGAAREPLDVVLVPQRSDFAPGFARARQLLDEGRGVRLVGHGITFRAAWPEWLRRRRDVLFTELGAYAVGDIAGATHEVRREIERWLDEMFAGVVPGLSGSLVFYGSASNRFLQPLLESYQIILGLARRHPDARFHCVDAEWVGLETLRGLVQPTGGVVSPGRRARRGWRARLAATVVAAFGATVVEQLRSRWQARASHAALQHLRSANEGIRPRLWVVMAPDWSRINQHVLDSIALPEVARGEPLGVLLFSSLALGMRSESNMKHHIGRELWPGLGELRPDLPRCTVDQLVSPDSLGDFAALLGRAALSTARVTTRLLRGPGTIDRGAFQFPLGSAVGPLGRMLTLELFRTLAAERAARAATARHSFAGSMVVLSGSSFAPENVADLVLQRAGAMTVDFFHGTGDCYWIGSSQSRSSLRSVWTRADAEVASRFGQRVLVSGMPRRVEPRAGREGPAKSILILSNYVHRDTAVAGSFPLAPFQDELLDTVEVIRRGFGDRFRFRWRPHPADNAAAVQETAGRLRDVEISRGRPLDEDVHWADLMISSLSSATFEALCADLPIFVHAKPIFRDFPTVSWFEPSRRFFRAEELAGPFAECVAALDRGDPDALDPERRARARFFAEADPGASIVEALRRAQVSRSGSL